MSANMLTAEAAATEKRVGYYKKSLSHIVDSKPEGWDEALPFEAVPGPKPVPILGNMWRFLPYLGDYYNVPLEDFYKILQREYGNVVILKGIFGRKPIVMVYDPEDMKTFLKNSGPFPIRNSLESYVYYRTYTREDVFQGVAGLSAVAICNIKMSKYADNWQKGRSGQGEDWFRFRTMINPILMQHSSAQLYVGRMDEVASELIEKMRYLSTLNENNEMPEDFQNELYKWALESIGIISFNKRLGCLNLKLDEGSETQKLTSHVEEMFELMYRLDVLPPVWKLFSTPSWRKYVKCLDFITSTVLKHVEEGLANTIDENVPEHELSVLQRLAKVDKKVAVAMGIDMVTAGIDTTGRTLGAALYLLAKNPDKQERLREEILTHLPEKDSSVTKDILNDSVYLKAVVKETTRIAPIAVGHMRTTVSDLVLGGYKIPKNTDVMSMNLLSSQSHEFKDPEEFIPERWLETTDDEYSYMNAHPFAFLPFGYGSRSCAGKRLANLELQVALTRIIRNFELSWPHEEDMVFTAKLLYGIGSPLKLKVRPFKE